MICKGCQQEKELESFAIRKDRSGKRRPYCNECKNDIARVRYKAYKRDSPFKLRVLRLKVAAKLKNVPFDIDAEHLESIWTGVCPVLKIPIFLYERERLDEQAAEVDRIVPSKGYVKGNVAYLSRRANRLKNNVTSAELLSLYTWLKGVEDDSPNS